MGRWKEGQGHVEIGNWKGAAAVTKQFQQKATWMGALLHEMFGMPRRHIVTFVVATVALVILEVEITEGWHLIHILELLGGMGFLYLLWAAWRARFGGGE
ncbi:MAG: hypothetical protein NZM29_03025 [Nitrospira sp.]|nr:hypothetical protein [Nitrospira sp.]